MGTAHVGLSAVVRPRSTFGRAVGILLRHILPAGAIMGLVPSLVWCLNVPRGPWGPPLRSASATKLLEENLEPNIIF